MKSFEEWQRSGFKVRKGEKMQSFNISLEGRPPNKIQGFTQAQVYKPKEKE